MASAQQLARLEDPQALPSGVTAHIIEVIDGDTVVLDNGDEVRLVGTQAPKLPLGRPGFVAWPMADEARAALEDLALGHEVRLHYGGLRRDRYDRVLAHLLRLGDGLWIQAAMIERGMARVYSFDDNRALLHALYAREREARAQRIGLWDHDAYQLRSATDPALLERLGAYELVEGRVLSVGRAGRSVFLNFGNHWKTDFTIVISKSSLRHFRETGIDVKRYEGRRIRVRGWIEENNGPMIEVTHPEQIEDLNN